MGDKRLLDSLWNHYWVNTLSSSLLITNSEYTTGQINDLAAKLDSWDTDSGRGGYSLNQEGADKKAEDKLGKATKDSCKITTEVLHGIMTQVQNVKRHIASIYFHNRKKRYYKILRINNVFI